MVNEASTFFSSDEKKEHSETKKDFSHNERGELLINNNSVIQYYWLDSTKTLLDKNAAEQFIVVNDTQKLLINHDFLIRNHYVLAWIMEAWDNSWKDQYPEHFKNLRVKSWEEFVYYYDNDWEPIKLIYIKELAPQVQQLQEITIQNVSDLLKLSSKN